MPAGVGFTLWLNGFVGKVPAFDSLMRLVVNDYFIPVSMTLIFVVVMWFGARSSAQRERNQRAVMYAAIGVGFANLWIQLTKVYCPWERPFVDYPAAARAVELLFYRPPDPTFPSNPAAVGFAMAAGIWFGNRRVAAVLYAMTLLWCFARLYAGICYPLDILAGALLGALTSIVIAKAFIPLLEPIATWFLKVARWFNVA